MKKVLLSSVLLGSLLVGCSQSEENNQFSVTCQDANDGCSVWYNNQDKEVHYNLDYNETLYFNYPDEARIRLSSYNHNTKIYSTQEIVTDSPEDIKIIENNIIILN